MYPQPTEAAEQIVSTRGPKQICSRQSRLSFLVHHMRSRQYSNRTTVRKFPILAHKPSFLRHKKTPQAGSLILGPMPLTMPLAMPLTVAMVLTTTTTI